MNLNELAKEISKLEGGKKQLSIAQIKEVVKCLSITLYNQWHMHGRQDFNDDPLVNALWKNGKKRAGKK